MKKKVLIVLTIILVLIIGIGGFFYLNKDSESSDAIKFSYFNLYFIDLLICLFYNVIEVRK